jgi:hypothetical protein
MQLKKFASFLNESKKEGVPFEELSPESKQKAIEKQQDINVDDDRWWEFIVEGFIEDMQEFYGVDVEEGDVAFTGFYSQGDGASFTGEVGDVKKFLEKALNYPDMEYLNMGKQKEENDELVTLLSDLDNLGYDIREKLRPEDITIKFVRSNSNYVHENTVSAEVEAEETPESWDTDKKFNWTDYHEWLGSLESECTTWLRSECKDLYRKLEEEYESLQEDQAVEETLISNDYLFDEEGNIVG